MTVSYVDALAPPAVVERFWRHVDQSGGPDACWPWRGERKRKGYGRFYLGPRRLTAHRAALTIARGPIPDGLQACHTCDNPPCCNLAHLYAGTDAQNKADQYRTVAA